MRIEMLLFATITLLALPLAAADLEKDPAPLPEVEAVTAEAAQDQVVPYEPVSLRELVDGFLIPVAWGFEDCGQTGACNRDRDCRWMEAECPLGTFPVCDQSTGSGCLGECACGW